MSAIPIKVDSSGSLSFEGDRLATLEEYFFANRSTSSIFNTLNPGKIIELSEGLFVLNKTLDPYRVKTLRRDRTHHTN